MNELPIEYRWIGRFLPMDKTDATRQLNKLRRQWFAKRKSIAAILKEVMTNEQSVLVDTDAALIEARRLLVPGGQLLISTPNLAAWFNRALLLFGVQPVFSEVSIKGIYGRPGTEVVGHLHLFTRRALVGLLAANGFVNIKVSGAPYHDVPRPFRPLDRLLCATPSLASILLASAEVPS